MRKIYLFMLALLSAVGAWAQETDTEYTWSGGATITAGAWDVASNWSPSVFAPNKTTGPGTPGSNLWGVINISNVIDKLWHDNSSYGFALYYSCSVSIRLEYLSSLNLVSCNEYRE